MPPLAVGVSTAGAAANPCTQGVLVTCLGLVCDCRTSCWVSTTRSPACPLFFLRLRPFPRACAPPCRCFSAAGEEGIKSLLACAVSLLALPFMSAWLALPPRYKVLLIPPRGHLTCPPFDQRLGLCAATGPGVGGSTLVACAVSRLARALLVCPRGWLCHHASYWATASPMRPNASCWAFRRSPACRSVEPYAVPTGPGHHHFQCRTVSKTNDVVPQRRHEDGSRRFGALHL